MMLNSGFRNECYLHAAHWLGYICSVRHESKWMNEWMKATGTMHKLPIIYKLPSFTHFMKLLKEYLSKYLELLSFCRNRYLWLSSRRIHTFFNLLVRSDQLYSSFGNHCKNVNHFCMILNVNFIEFNLQLIALWSIH